MLTVLLSVRFGHSCRLSGCGVSSSRPSRRHAVAARLIISSFLAPFLRYGGRGARSGRVGCLRRGMAFSCPLDVVSSRVRYRRWCSAACFAAVVLLSFSSRFSFRSTARFASLRHSLRPATRWAGRCLAAIVPELVRRSFSLLAVRGGGVSYPHGVLSFWVIFAMRVLYVDYVALAGACRSCGIFVLSIGCIYRLIGFLICSVCPLLLLSASSYH